jgi:ubiquinone/menaquinone biosynthesis C-methylase UbiE
MNKFLHNAQEYTAHRPQYPLNLFAYLANLVPHKKVLLDCGTGSGQAARDLTKYFEYVIATDLSYDLLKIAPKESNLIYIKVEAEYLPIRSQTVDMITIGQALHWFSLNKFYGEVNRILKPNGIIAAWCYNQCVINPKINALISKIYRLVTSTENLTIQRQYVYNHYQTIPFPFKRISTPKFELCVEWNLKELYGYIATWPGLLEYEKNTNTNVLSQLELAFISAWGDINTKKTITWPIYLLVGELY